MWRRLGPKRTVFIDTKQLKTVCEFALNRAYELEVERQWRAQGEGTVFITSSIELTGGTDHHIDVPGFRVVFR